MTSNKSRRKKETEIDFNETVHENEEEIREAADGNEAEEIREDAEDIGTGENAETAEAASETVDTDADEPQDIDGEPKEPEPLRPGEAIRRRFMELVAAGISEEALAALTDKEGSRKAGLRYPFLKEFRQDVCIKELTLDAKGNPRYSAKPVELPDGRRFLICNDLYRSTVPKFMAWADSLG